MNQLVSKKTPTLQNATPQRHNTTPLHHDTPQRHSYKSLLKATLLRHHDTPPRHYPMLLIHHSDLHPTLPQ